MTAPSRRPIAALALSALICLAGACEADEESIAVTEATAVPAANMSPSVVAEGRQIFRFDTFGNETFWSDTAALHVKVNELSPQAALLTGLKVDVDALPAAVVQQLRDNAVNLADPAVTRLLLSVDAVVGVKGQVQNGALVRIGVTCALCHSTVDNSLTGGIGHRLDGWPNRDLNVGARSSRSPTRCPMRRTTPGDPECTTPASASTGRTFQSFFRRRSGCAT